MRQRANLTRLYGDAHNTSGASAYGYRVARPCSHSKGRGRRHSRRRRRRRRRQIGIQPRDRLRAPANGGAVTKIAPRPLLLSAVPPPRPTTARRALVRQAPEPTAREVLQMQREIKQKGVQAKDCAGVGRCTWYHHRSPRPAAQHAAAAVRRLAQANGVPQLGHGTPRRRRPIRSRPTGATGAVATQPWLIAAGKMVTFASAPIGAASAAPRVLQRLPPQQHWRRGVPPTTWGDGGNAPALRPESTVAMGAAAGGGARASKKPRVGAGGGARMRAAARLRATAAPVPQQPSWPPPTVLPPGGSNRHHRGRVSYPMLPASSRPPRPRRGPSRRRPRTATAGAASLKNWRLSAFIRHCTFRSGVLTHMLLAKARCYGRPAYRSQLHSLLATLRAVPLPCVDGSIPWFTAAGHRRAWRRYCHDSPGIAALTATRATDPLPSAVRVLSSSWGTRLPQSPKSS